MQFRDVLARKRPSRDALRKDDKAHGAFSGTQDAEAQAPATGKSLEETLAETLGSELNGGTDIREALDAELEAAEMEAEAEELAAEDMLPDAEDFAEAEETEPEAAFDAPAEPDFPEPAEIRPSSPRKQIWELEPEDDAADATGHDDEAAHPLRPANFAPPAEPRPLREHHSKPVLLRRPAATAAPAEPQTDEPAPAPQPAAGGRVKTRILGFHSGGLEADVFGAAEPARSAADMYPAGWIVVVGGPGRGASFSVVSGVSTIGRGSDQTICLDFGDPSISRQNHASVAYDAEQSRFFIGHGGKSNIVRRNGNPVLSTEELSDGDEIRIGKTTLKFVALCGPDFTWDEDEDAQGDDAGRF